MVARKRTRHAMETREGRGNSLSPRVSSLRDRSFLRSYYFIVPNLCRLSKTGTYLRPKEMTWLWDQKYTSLLYACAEVLTRTKNCPWLSQSHSQSSSMYEISVENVATTAGGYGFARLREVLGAVLVFERLARGWCSPVCGTPFVYTRCRSTVALSLT